MIVKDRWWPLNDVLMPSSPLNVKHSVWKVFGICIKCIEEGRVQKRKMNTDIWGVAGGAVSSAGWWSGSCPCSVCVDRGVLMHRFPWAEAQGLPLKRGFNQPCLIIFEQLHHRKK